MTNKKALARRLFGRCRKSGGYFVVGFDDKGLFIEGDLEDSIREDDVRHLSLRRLFIDSRSVISGVNLEVLRMRAEKEQAARASEVLRLRSEALGGYTDD